MPDGGSTASAGDGSGSTADGGSSSSGGSTASSLGGGTGSSGGSTASSSGGGSSGTGSSSGGNQPLGGRIIVTAGNTVIGAAGKHNELATTVNGAAPKLTPVTATVTRVLNKSGQTLVDIGNGRSLILNKAGGKVGDLLKIDLGSKTVIGAPNGSPLLGVGVLSPPGSGNIVTVTSSKATGGVGTITNPVTGIAPGTTAPQNGAVGGVVNKATGTVGTALGGLKHGR